MSETRLYRSIQCEDCLCLSKDAIGWIANVVEADQEEPDLAPYIVTYCPQCAEREFGA